MSRQAMLLCLAVATFAAACADDSTAPVVTPNVTRPSSAAGGNSSSNLHFVSADAALAPSPTLAISFKIAGVGSGQTINVTGAAQANRTDICVNGGENVPSDRKKKSTTQQVSLTLPLTATAGGSVEGTIFLTFPDSPLNCPGGQVAILLDASWTDVSVSTPSPSVGVTIEKTITGTYPVNPADRTKPLRLPVIQ